MQLINSRQAYGWLSIVLHWFAAASVLFLLFTGFSADWADDRDAHRALMRLHVAFGGAVGLILLARVFASYAQPHPAPVAQPPLLKFLSSATHQLLLLGILTQIVTGPLAVWTGGRAINIFDIVAIPSPFEENHDLHETMEEIHGIGRWVIVGALSLHIAGALKHALIDRDGVLQRMLVPGKPL